MAFFLVYDFWVFLERMQLAGCLFSSDSNDSFPIQLVCFLLTQLTHFAFRKNKTKEKTDSFQILLIRSDSLHPTQITLESDV